MKLVLIGMPGCGKTTIGSLTAKELRLKFIDLDAEIVKSTGKSINQIFADNGEGYFRELETNALKLSLKSSNAVISTGGGIVKLWRNIDAVRELGGYIVFIDRPIELIAGNIDTQSRPLLKDNAERLKSLYTERYDLYKRAADEVIVNDKELGCIVSKVCELYKSKRKGENV